MKIKQVVLISVVVPSLFLGGVLSTATKTTSLELTTDKATVLPKSEQKVANRFIDWWVDCWHNYCRDPFA